MTIETQKELNARHDELTELAKVNTCRCGGELQVIWSLKWYLWCASCGNTWSKYDIKPKPTRAEETATRIKKMEEAAKTPKNKYNIDELFGGK